MAFFREAIYTIYASDKNMTIYVAIVSHGHEKVIEEINCLPLLTQDDLIKVYLLDNIGEAGLKIYCDTNKINYLENISKKGFGENNNIIFSYVEENIGFTDDDYFLVLNPDVRVDFQSILNALEYSKINETQLSTINLYTDEEFKCFDYCVRTFPSLIDFISSYIGLGNKTIIDKELVTEPIKADWAAGSFLLFKASLYKKLGGFDPNYFMYCEDIDICFRAKKLFQQKLIFQPQIKAIHLAQHANRSLFSKHFFWHVKSMFRYLALFYSFRKPYK
jgi:N-acetylglucosaminyl-diphospho-decaprenol L-rhamnosyltransferase